MTTQIPAHADIDNPDPMLTDRFAAALQLATELHRFHLRKGSSIPYVSHLLAVAALVLEYGGSEDQAIAALLHDAIEDAGGAGTARRIERSFGPDVLRLVEGCTEIQDDPKPPWRVRKEAYVEHLIGEADADALLITLADKTHNAESTMERIRAEGAAAVWGLFNAPADQQAWWYAALASAYETRCPGALAARFRRAVDELVATSKHDG